MYLSITALHIETIKVYMWNLRNNLKNIKNSLAVKCKIIFLRLFMIQFI
jgi:hypothetical protein